jgi:23S rRNA (adenine2030-N6)-methyltransferase
MQQRPERCTIRPVPRPVAHSLNPTGRPDMLSYRHAFHAGNHADVLKHLVLVELLTYLAGKDKRFWYIDTHAGAGTYALDEGFAAKHREYLDGIGRLWSATNPPAELRPYLDLVRRANPQGSLAVYPGSPWFARALTREADRLWLCELHPTDYEALAEHFVGRDRRIRVMQNDGYAELRRLLPPEPRRALVMIDPSYELASDYAKLIEAIRDSLTRFAPGVYAIWYPQLRSREADELPSRLRKCGAQRWLNVRLSVRNRAGPHAGLYGSGVYVINPPYTLPATLDALLPSLVELLAQDEKANYELDFNIP